MLRPQSMQVLEKIERFRAATFRKLCILSIRILFCYTVAFITFFAAVTVIRITRFRIVNHFLGIILLKFGFLFLPLGDWRASKNLPTETSLCP